MKKLFCMRVTADFTFDMDIEAETLEEAKEIIQNEAYNIEDYNRWTFDGIVDCDALLVEPINKA